MFCKQKNTADLRIFLRLHEVEVIFSAIGERRKKYFHRNCFFSTKNCKHIKRFRPSLNLPPLPEVKQQGSVQGMKIKNDHSVSRRLLAVGLCFSLSACGILNKTAPPVTPEAAQTKAPESHVPANPADNKTSKVIVEGLAEKKSATLSDIEVLWQIPTQPVDGFVIQYGYEKNTLDQQVKIATKDLEKFEDSKFGFVFRYVLGDLPLSKTVFVTISAYTGEKVSHPSEVFTVIGEAISK